MPSGEDVPAPGRDILPLRATPDWSMGGAPMDTGPRMRPRSFPGPHAGASAFH